MVLFEKIFWIFLLTLLPGLELRFSIPVGILHSTVSLPFGLAFQGFGLDPFLVFIVAVASNAILGALVFLALRYLLEFALLFPLVKKFYSNRVLAIQKEIRPLVEKYGAIGLAIFIAIPLPGTGSWSGALAAFLIGMRFRTFFLMNALGVFIAGILVTLATVGLLALF